MTTRKTAVNGWLRNDERMKSTAKDATKSRTGHSSSSSHYSLDSQADNYDPVDPNPGPSVPMMPYTEPKWRQINQDEFAKLKQRWTDAAEEQKRLFKSHGIAMPKHQGPPKDMRQVDPRLKQYFFDEVGKKGILMDTLSPDDQAVILAKF